MKLLRVFAKWPAVFAVLVVISPGFGLSVTSYVSDADGITCTCNTGVMKVKICQADIVRVAYSPTSTIPERTLKIVTKAWATPSFTKSEVGDDIVLQTSKIKVKVNKTTANVTYTDLSDAVILEEYSKAANPTTVQGISSYKLIGTWNSPADEGLFGLGQHQDGKVNYKGQTEYIEQRYAVATAVPVLISTKGYGIFWDSYAYNDFAGNLNGNTRFSFTAECGDVLDYYFFYGPEIDQVISGYRTATGKAPLFPKWAYGLIQSKDKYLSQKEFLAVKDGYRNNKIPLDCIVQDWHYWDGAGAQGCYCFNSGYGNVKSTITQCHQANIHTMISIWSQLEQGSPPYKTFSDNGWLWPVSGGGCTTNFIDAYSSAGREAFWTLIRDAIFDTTKIGFDSWWLDNDEPLGYPCGLDLRGLTNAMGKKNVLTYNTYTFPMSLMGYTNWRKDIPSKRFVMLHRANFPGQQAHSTMQWSNDIQCDWPTLKKSVPCGLNTTITGIPYWCTDIGGYWGNSCDFTQSSNQELMVRWLQYGAFQPVFRIHGNMKGGQGKELYSTTFSDATRANLLIADKLHYRLMPYIYSIAWMTTNADYTPMRMLVFDFRTDPAVKSIGDQFMYGPAIMVSPVTALSATSRSVYLPAGKWYDFWTGATVAGGATVNSDAPISQIPMHIRAGSILPMGPEIQYATERADTIELRVYPGANGSFTLYEDEGDNYNYETGKFGTIAITYDDAAKNVTIGQRKGSFPNMDLKKVFNIVFVSSNHGVGITKTATPDKQVLWDGTGSSVLPMQGAAEQLLPAEVSMRVVGNMMALPSAFAGISKRVAVYNCSGKLLQKAVVKKNTIDLRKDLGLPGGIYIVKAKAAF